MQVFAPVKHSFTGVRQNAECPVCSARERHRAACALLRRDVFSLSSYTETSKLRVLHNGPQPMMARLLDAASNVTHIKTDYFANGYEKLYPGSFKADVQHLEFPSEFFHLIISLHVIEHVTSVTAAIGHFYRLLDPRGQLFFEVPCSSAASTKSMRCRTPQQRLEVCKQFDHQWLFACRDIAATLLFSGFNCTTDVFSSAEINDYALARNSAFFLCKK